MRPATDINDPYFKSVKDSPSHDACARNAFTLIWYNVRMKNNRICKLFCAASFIASVVLCAPLVAQTTAPAAATAVAASWPTDEAGLNALAGKLINGWFQQIADKDMKGVMAAMQPTFQVITFEGVFDPATSIGYISSLGTKAPTVSKVIATRVGDALIATCLVKADQEIDGKKLSSDAMPRLGVWQIVDGAWKIAAWASLSSPTPRPAPKAPAFAGDAALNAQGATMLTKLLMAQHKKELPAFDAMLATGLQIVNFKGQLGRDDMINGAKRATTEMPVLADTRATKCGDLLVVTCNLTMGQKVAFTTIPADPAPFLAVFQGSGDGAKVIAIANTNKPK